MGGSQDRRRFSCVLLRALPLVYVHLALSGGLRSGVHLAQPLGHYGSGDVGRVLRDWPVVSTGELMARWSRKQQQENLPAVIDPEKSLVASAARITNIQGLGWRTYKFGDDTWQQEAWRLYDTIGELRYLANWVGSACSRVRIYVAEVDKNGRVQQETEKPKVAALADTLFGSPASKAEALRMLGINLTVAGDAYIIGRETPDPNVDDWFVVSCSELKRWGTRLTMVWPDGEKEPLDPNSDIVIRVWTPHPRRSLWADSPTRAAMPMLWEIERLTRFVFAQIDSRLISAGLLAIPKEASFPDAENPELSASEAMTERLTEAGSRSLKGEGSAAGVVPMIAEFPTDALGKIQFIQFTSELSKQALDLRSEAIRRFALAMDVSPEILTGTGDANHWAAWHVDVSNVKIHIEPIMTRICDALTSSYLAPGLKGIKEDPDRYIFWYDTAPLVVRPQRLEDTLNLYLQRVVGREAVLLAGDYKLTDVPSDAEDLKLFTRDLMLRDPTLFQIPAVRRVAGYTEEVLPANTPVTPPQPQPGVPGLPGAGPPPPPPPPTGIQPTGPTPLPQNSTAQNALGGPANGGNPPNGVTAATSVPSAINTFVVANASVLRALELAGKRLLTHSTRNQWPDVPAHELHTRIRVSGEEHGTKLLAGAWDHFGTLAAQLDPGMDSQGIRDCLQDYCLSLLTSEEIHTVNRLADHLRQHGFIDG